MTSSIKKTSDKFKQELKDIYSLSEIQQILFMIFEKYANLSKVEVITYPEKELKPKESIDIENALLRLIKYEPVQYILGETEFYELKFYVTDDVLIPRQETEELVDYIVKNYKNKNHLKIIDFGTGSGCIAISLSINLPKSDVYGVDISRKAIKTARKNAELNNTDIHFIENDILNLDFSILPQDVDIIVSNPPYVCNSEKKLMQKNVLEYEPKTALFVEDSNPLVFYDKIADAGIKLLKKEGLIIFEINEKFALQMQNLLTNKGYKNIEVIKDLNNKYRIVRAVL